MTIALRGLRGRLLIAAAATAGFLCAPLAADAAVVYRDSDTLRIHENPPAPSTANPNETNDIVVTYDGTDFIVTDRGGTNPTTATVPVGCTASGNTARCPAAGIDKIDVQVGDNRDFVDLRDPSLAVLASSTINGGPGVDDLQGLIADPDTINGGDDADNIWGNGGNDPTLSGDQGDDTIRGGAGDDTMYGGAGADVFAGEDGTGDTVSYQNDGTSGVGATISDSAKSGAGCQNPGAPCEGDVIRSTVENLIGTAGDDVLTGSDAGNSLSGLGGADRLFGLAGVDNLNGGAGNDRLQGGTQADTLDGGADNGDWVDYTDRTVPGTAGKVIVDLSGSVKSGGTEDDGGDTVSNVENAETGAGDDELIGNDGATGNELRGNDGNDSFRGKDGPDQFFGGNGVDSVSYFDEDDDTTNNIGVTVTIGNGNGNDGGDDDGAQNARDTVHGDIEDVIGSGDDDVLEGSVVNNQLDGVGGNDTLRGLAGADVLIGGAGSDTASYSDRATSVIATLDGVNNDGNELDGPDGARDLITTTVENLTGGNADDSLTGDEFANRLEGGNGNDLLRGGDKAPTLRGDTFVGGGGSDDTVDYSSDARSAGVTVTVGNNAADDGGATEGDNVGTDVENVVGTAFKDILMGSPVDNDLYGLGGDDTLEGQAGNDLLDGGLGKDTISGEADNDTLHGGTNEGGADAADSIDGGTGNDTVTYAAASAAPYASQARAADRPVRVTLGTAAGDGDIAAGENDAVNLVENAIGGEGSDELIGTFDPNRLDGRGGDDRLVPGPEGATPVADTLVGGDGLRDHADYSDRASSDNLVITLDGVANDGETDEKDNVHADVEDVTTAGGADSVTGSAAANVIATRAGTDTVDVADASADRVDCGPDADSATADHRDALENCESQTFTTKAQLTVGPAQVTEGTGAGTTNLPFTVTVDAPAGSDVTFQYTLAEGTATAPEDFTAPAGATGTPTGATGTATIPAGQSQTTINVPVQRDSLDEADETLTITLSSPSSNGAIAGGTATGTIVDDDGEPTVSVGSASVTEGNSATKTLNVPVTLSAASGKTVTVKYSTGGGTATPGNPGDYDAVNQGTVTIPAGQTTANAPVTIRGDTVDEPDETFVVTLTNPAGATLGTASATQTITDDDGAPSLSVAAGEVTEGNEGSKDLTFTITLSNASSQDVAVKYATADGTAKAGEDYTATSGTLTIKAGQTAGEVKVPVTGDTAVEEDETFTLTLSEAQNAAFAEGKDTATGTIRNDDQAVVTPPAVPAISVNDIKVAEGDTGTTPAVFTVSLSVPTTATVTVKYVTSDGTATSGADYAVTAGTLTFNPGERSKTVSVPVIGDRVDEPDEAFALALVEPQGGTLGKATGAALITDDEEPRVAPRGVTAKTTPSADRRLPYRFRTTGSVQLPSGVRKADGCAGKVQVRFKTGSRTISVRRVTLRKDCTFRRSVSFGEKSRIRTSRLKVSVRFLGNAVLLPKSAKTRYVRVR